MLVTIKCVGSPIETLPINNQDVLLAVLSKYGMYATCI